MPEIPDAGSAEDTGVTPDAQTQPDTQTIDGVVIGVKDRVCQYFTPEEWGLPADTERPDLIISGDGCGIYVVPATDCEGLPDVIDVQSHVQFNGTMFVYEKKLTLQEGEMLYKAFRGGCNDFPDTSVRAIGIELKPDGMDEAQIQAKLQEGNLGELLMRVHIWEGDSHLAMNGEDFISLVTGMQVLVDSGGNIREFHNFNEPIAAPDAGETQGSTGVPKEEPAPGGCSTTNSANSLDWIFAVVAIMTIGKMIRNRISHAGLGAFIGFFNR